MSNKMIWAGPERVMGTFDTIFARVAAVAI